MTANGWAPGTVRTLITRLLRKQGAGLLRSRFYALFDASIILSITWSRLKLADFCRGGNSLKVLRNSPTIACEVAPAFGAIGPKRNCAPTILAGIARMMEEARNSFDVQPNVSNHFSWLRTRLALERTFMAWMRTAVSLIGFGFTITQFFARLQNMPTDALRPMGEDAPRNLGLTLIACGVAALAISAWQYRESLKYLSSEDFRTIRKFPNRVVRTPVFTAAMVLMGVGIAAFVAVFFRMT